MEHDYAPLAVGIAMGSRPTSEALRFIGRGGWSSFSDAPICVYPPLFGVGDRTLEGGDSGSGLGVNIGRLTPSPARQRGDRCTLGRFFYLQWVPEKVFKNSGPTCLLSNAIADESGCGRKLSLRMKSRQP